MVSGEDVDLQIRCNQIWALTLTYTMLSQDQERKVLRTVKEKLYTPFGLRTLSPDDPGAANDYLPHNYPEHCVAYTGTHDNETTSGWFMGLDPEGKKMVRDYLCNHSTPDDEMYKCLVSTAMMSKAETCIIPIQDYLGLGNEARMNVPSLETGNWGWRLKADTLTEERCKEVREITRRYGRFNWDNEK